MTKFDRSVFKALMAALSLSWVGIAGLPAQAATASSEVFGIAQDGRPVQLITLRNKRGMVVRFSARGGAIVEISVPDRNGKLDNVVLGQASFDAWERAGSFNTVVGRYADRIDGGSFTLDGQVYKLAGLNPNSNLVIHGGPSSFGSKLWAVGTFQRGAEAGATLDYLSPDGENGFPGNLDVRMTYTLTDDNVLRLEYQATTDKPTVVNLTNHAYFNLAGAGSGPVYDHTLQIFADSYALQNSRQLPTGELAPVAGTPFDFRKATRIGDNINAAHPQLLLSRGIDTSFILKPQGPRLALAARLIDSKTGRQMDVRTNETTVRVYTANNLNGTTVGANGRTLRQSDGICLETEHLPNSPNQPTFPSTTLRPGQAYRTAVEYAFSVASKAASPRASMQ